jgi:hypothetical protein
VSVPPLAIVALRYSIIWSVLSVSVQVGGVVRKWYVPSSVME